MLLSRGFLVGHETDGVSGRQRRTTDSSGMLSVAKYSTVARSIYALSPMVLFGSVYTVALSSGALPGGFSIWPRASALLGRLGVIGLAEHLFLVMPIGLVGLVCVAVAVTALGLVRACCRRHVGRVMGLT